MRNFLLKVGAIFPRIAFASLNRSRRITVSQPEACWLRKVTLADLFAGRNQLAIYHFMFGLDDVSFLRAKS
jgi:hypothetical protein